VRGALEVLIPKTLALDPLHGYGVALRIEQISKGAFPRQPWLVVAGACSHGTGVVHQQRVARKREQSSR